MQLTQPAFPLFTRPFLMLCLAAAFLHSARSQEATIYSDQTPLPHWSEGKVSTDRAGKPYHGPFGNQSASLTLEHLPEHRWIKVSFDLYIVGSWDGSSPVWGPDLWSFSVRGAQNLVSATFCGWGYSGNNEQSYPDDYPHAVHPAWTGATGRDVLDIQDSQPPKNGAYRVEVLFPHTADQISLDFAGTYVDPPTEQQVWGVGGVEVRTFSAEALTGAEALPRLWEELASNDGIVANRALWRFVGAGEDAVSFLKEKVEAMDDSQTLSFTDNLRLHRAHRIAWIIRDDKETHDLCFRMDQLSAEYAHKYLGR